MKFTTYFLIFVLSAIGGFYTGLFLYHYKQSKEQKVTETQSQIPEYLTKDFWKRVTPDQLKEKLKNVENLNEVRPDDKMSMLHLLAKYGNYPEMVGLLINKGVDYKLKDITNAKALHHAVVKKAKPLEFTKEFLKYDTDVNELGSGATVLMWAVYMRMPIKVITLLLEKGADPHFRMKTGNHALFLASVPNKHTGDHFIDPRTIQLLLDHKVDIKIKNTEGKTAYDFMKENEEFKKTELFKEISKQFESTSDTKKAPPSKK